MNEIRIILEAYPASFESMFSIVNEKLRYNNNMLAWYNRHLDFIYLYIGFKPPSLSYLQDSTTLREVEITAAYIYAYITYRKICSLLSRQPTMEPFFSGIENI